MRNTIQSKIIALAREQLGTPFRHQGRLPGKYLDCAGLVFYVAGQIGAAYEDLPGYSRIPHDGLMESVLDKQPCLTEVFDKQPGDILLMRITRDPQHVAIYTGDTIIHSYSEVCKVVEHRLDEVWEKRIVSIYRFTGVEG